MLFCPFLAIRKKGNHRISWCHKSLKRSLTTGRCDAQQSEAVCLQSHSKNHQKSLCARSAAAQVGAQQVLPIRMAFPHPRKSSKCFLWNFPGRQELHLLDSYLTLASQGQVHVVSVKVRQGDHEMKPQFLITSPEALPAGTMGPAAGEAACFHIPCT